MNNNKKERKEYDKKYREKRNQRDKERYYYQISWGGDKRCQNNLLLIDPNLFNQR